MLRTTFRAVAVASDTGRAVGRDIYINGTRAHPSRSCQIAGLTYLAVHAPHGAGPRRVIRAQSSRLRTRVSREGHGVSSSVALLSEAGPAKAGCAATLRSLRGRSGASCQPSFPCQPSRDIFPCRIWSRRSTARSARCVLTTCGSARAAVHLRPPLRTWLGSTALLPHSPSQICDAMTGDPHAADRT